MTHIRRVLAWLLFLAIAVGWYVYLRPPLLGGSTAYVFVRGTSMEPRYHAGDLVLVRKKARYEVGDIAAFAVAGNNGKQAVVIHRIIAVEPDGSHILQGDNREAADPWHPTRDEIVGSPIALLPEAGRWLAELAARPIVLGVVCGALAGFIVLVGDGRNDDRRAQRRPTGRPIPRILVDLVADVPATGLRTSRC